MTTAKTANKIPVRYMSLAEMIEEQRRIVEKYEQSYDMLSAELADLVDRDAIEPTIEVMTWYQAYDVLQFLIATTPTTGTRGTITEASTNFG